MRKFQKGDRVRCINSLSYPGIEQGREYTVFGYYHSAYRSEECFVQLKEQVEEGMITGGWYEKQFELVRPVKVDWTSDELWEVRA